MTSVAGASRMLSAVATMSEVVVADARRRRRKGARGAKAFAQARSATNGSIAVVLRCIAGALLQ